MNRIRFYLLKSPQVFQGEAEIFQDLHTKAKALLFYLAMNKKQSFSRDQLSEMFWPEQSQDNSRSNLRQALSAIRRAAADAGLLEDLLLTEKRNCSIRDPKAVWVDALVFSETVKQGKQAANPQEKIRFLQQAADLYHNGFLTGFHVKGSSTTEEWLLFERESLSQAFSQACLKLADLCEATSAEDQAVACLLKLLKSNPLQEEVHRRLMSLYDRKGLRYKAIEQYRQCAGLLRSELNLSPMEETEALYKRILMEESMPSRTISEKASPFTSSVSNQPGHSVFTKNSHSASHNEHHLYWLEDEAEIRLLLHQLNSSITRDKGPPLLVAEALAEISLLDYAGYYQLFNDLCGREKSSAITAQILGEPLEAGRIFAFSHLLEELAENHTVLLCFRCFEELDEPTKRLALYLLHHCRHPAVRILVTFCRREALKGILEKLSCLPNSVKTPSP